MGDGSWDYYSPLFPDPQLPFPFDGTFAIAVSTGSGIDDTNARVLDFPVLSADTRPLEPLVLPALPSRSRAIIPIDVTSTSRAHSPGNSTASDTLESTASHTSAELMGTIPRLTPRRTASQLPPTLTISPGPRTSMESSEEEGSTTMRLPVVPPVPSLPTTDAPQRFTRNLWKCATPTPDSDFFTELGHITPSTTSSVYGYSPSGLADWSSFLDTLLDDFPHIPAGHVDHVWMENVLQEYIDPLIGTTIPTTTTTTTNKRKSSPSSDSDSQGSTKKMKTSGPRTNDSTPNGADTPIRWATPVVQTNYHTEQGASASEDAPTHDDLPQFQPGVESGPAEGLSTGKKAEKPKKAVKRKRASRPKKATNPPKPVFCPVAGCNGKYTRLQDLRRHLCTDQKTHPQIRDVPDWQQRCGVPKNFKGKLMSCPFSRCKHISKSHGMRRCEVDKHMRARHGGMDVTMWLKRVATLIRRRERAGLWTAEDMVSTRWKDMLSVTNFVQREGEEVPEKGFLDWCLRYVLWES